MIQKEVVERLVMERIEGSSLFLVDIIISSGNNIQVHIDKMEGISIEECVEMSRYLNSKMDRDNEDYSLEVSSPGLNASFKVRQQYEKNIGRDIEVVTESGEKYSGKLLRVDEEKILMETKEKVPAEGSQKKKKSVIVKKEVDFTRIIKTKTVISFK